MAVSGQTEISWPTPWGWVLGQTGWASLLVVAVFVVFLAMSIDGARLVFRGTRDYIHVTLEKRATAARFAGFVAAVLLFFSGWAPLVTLAAWFAGVPPFGKWPNPHNPNAHKQ